MKVGFKNIDSNVVDNFSWFLNSWDRMRFQVFFFTVINMDFHETPFHAIEEREFQARFSKWYPL